MSPHTWAAFVRICSILTPRPRRGKSTASITRYLAAARCLSGRIALLIPADVLVIFEGGLLEFQHRCILRDCADLGLVEACGGLCLDLNADCQSYAGTGRERC
jgi:hypothetical protein